MASRSEGVAGPSEGKPAQRTRGQSVAFVLVASLAFAVSSPVARWARPAHPLTVASGRLALACLLLGALAPRALLHAVRTTTPRQRLTIALAGLLLGGHFALFLCGLDATSLPAAVALVSLEPLAVVVAAWIVHRDRPTRLEGLGVVVATLGAGIVGLGAGNGEHRLVGDLLVIAGVVLYGLYVATARGLRTSAIPSRTSAALVYGVAALSVAVLLPFVHAPVFALPAHSIVAIALLASIPTVIGHTLVQAAARILSPSTVALVSPGETLGSLAIGAVLLGAVPTARETLGAAVVVAGATIAILGSRVSSAP